MTALLELRNNNTFNGAMFAAESLRRFNIYTVITASDSLDPSLPRLAQKKEMDVQLPATRPTLWITRDSVTSEST